MSKMTTMVLQDCFALRARIGWQGLRADEFQDYGPYLVTGTDFINGKVNWDTCYHVTEERFKQDTGIQLHEHDLLVTKDGTIGKTAIVQNCPEKTTLNSGVFVVRAINKSVVPEYLYYVLSSRDFETFLANTLTGSTIKHLNQEHFYKFSFPAPTDTKEQAKIAEVLATVDEVIDKTRQMIAKYKNIKVGLLNSLLLGSASKDSHRTDSPWGVIPKSWDVKKIGDFAVKVGSGATPKGGEAVYLKEGILFLRSQNVTHDGLALEDVAYIAPIIHKQMKRSQVMFGDVLLNITGASIGRCVVYPLDQEANVNQHVCIIRLADGNDLMSQYLYRWLTSEYGQSQIKRLMGGSNREGLSFAQIREIQLPFINDEEELKNILAPLDAIDEKISNEQRNFEKLIRIRDGLMQDLLTQKVSVEPIM